jgi:hypothetical protein
VPSIWKKGAAWPFGPHRFAGIVVTNYLHRPLIAAMLDSLAPNGVLIYETFAEGNAQFGKPSNPAFLLQPGELLELAREHGLRVVALKMASSTPQKLRWCSDCAPSSRFSPRGGSITAILSVDLCPRMHHGRSLSTTIVVLILYAVVSYD